MFALDDAGVIGVRIVNAVGRVEFNPVEIIREDSDGVWVAGLPEMTTVITVGQELVVPGNWLRWTSKQPRKCRPPHRQAPPPQTWPPTHERHHRRGHQPAKTTLLVLFMVVLAGLAARVAIPIANDPSIQVPFFVVTIVHEGISPKTPSACW